MKDIIVKLNQDISLDELSFYFENIKKFFGTNNVLIVPKEIELYGNEDYIDNFILIC